MMFVAHPITDYVSQFNSSELLSLFSSVDKWLMFPLPYWTSKAKAKAKAKVKFTLLPTLSLPVCLGVWHQAGTRDEFFSSFFNYINQLWVCFYGSPSQTRGRVCSFQSLLGLASAVFLWPESRWAHYHILVSQFFRLPQPGGPGSCIYFTQEQGSPVISPGIQVQVQVQVILRPTVSRLVNFGVGPPSGAHEQILITFGSLQSLCCGTSSLTIRRACNLLVQFAVTLRFKTRRTHDHILLSPLRLLDYLFVASQGYGGDILTRLHTALIVLLASQSQCYITTGGQSASLSCCQASIWDP
jgi:hypothetical protein